MPLTAASFLALVFTLTTGVAGVAFHLCGMEGLVQRTCCCHEEDEKPPVALEQVDDCCGALMTSGERLPFAAGSGDGKLDSPILSLAAAAMDGSCREPLGEVTTAPLARGSPITQGRPLFALNCSYLN
ncbi:MAG: hypothetical protein JRE81_15555 [Deltaproteobacteria bacterium]|jgi:hypothetical protein|nr:hypothetical protein [Deltaproteobacteria bacterium]